MSCYQSASAVTKSGITGFILIIKVKVFGGFNPPAIEKGTPPFEPNNVFPVTILRGLPTSPTLIELKVTQNLTSENEFDSVEIFCGDVKPGTIIPITKE